MRQAQQQLAALQLPPVPEAALLQRPPSWDPAGEVRRLAAYLAAAGGSTLAAQLPAVAGAPGMTVERLVAAALAELFKGRLAAAEAAQVGALAAPCVLDAGAADLAPALPQRAGPETPVPAGVLVGQPGPAGAGPGAAAAAAAAAAPAAAAAAAAPAAPAPFSYKAALLAKGGGGAEQPNSRQLAALREARLRYGSGAGDGGVGVAAGLAGLEAGVDHLQSLLAGVAALAERLPAA